MALGGPVVEGTPQLIVRLEPDLHDALKRWAASEDRSLAAQVRMVLRGAVPGEFTGSDR